MPRAARIKYAIEEGGFYHCMNRAAGSPDWYPFAFSDENPHGTACRRKLLSLFKFYSHAYCLSTASLKIMGNHFHIVACAEPYRKMTQEELFERALRFYPNSDKKLRLWDQGDWNWFSHRIFDISEFMRNVEGLFSTWYNETFNRRGSFWADRFKSTLLTDMGAVRDCVLYVDLNAVRAGLVERPEDYEGGSAFFREIGADDWLMTLEDIFFPEEEPGSRSPEEVYEAYKGLLYYRGGAPTKEGQCSIPEEIIEAEEACPSGERV